MLPFSIQVLSRRRKIHSFLETFRMLETSFNDFGIEFVHEFEYAYNVISLIKIKLAIKIVNRVIVFMNELLNKDNRLLLNLFH